MAGSLHGHGQAVARVEQRRDEDDVRPGTRHLGLVDERGRLDKPVSGDERCGVAGRDLGPESIHENTSAKSVVMNIDAQVPPYYKR